MCLVQGVLAACRLGHTGLAPGARVVVYPSDSVSEGIRLKVVRGPQ